jgi:glycosyltransferase involved in cell wall biosynthesis
MSVSPARPIATDFILPRSASPYKVLHVITSMDPVHGGPPEGIRQMSKALANMGHHIEVACLDRAGSSGTEDSLLKIHAVGPSMGKYHYSRSFIPWLRANVGRFDCVIAHDVWQYPCLATWRTLRRSATPYFVFTHGMLDPWFRRTYPLKHLKKAVYWRAGGHKVLRDARAVFFTSEEEKLLAGQSFRPYQSKGVTVGFGTTGARGNAVELRRAFLQAFPELVGKKLVLYLGRVSPKKGLDILIEAFAKTVAKDYGYQLVVAGPNNTEWKAVLEQQASRLGIARNISWTGLLSDGQKWGAFYASDIFCLPSHQENFALVVCEALSCGLPVVISNKVNIWREIDSVCAGFVDDDDVVGTARSLERWLLLSADEQDAMRERARHCFERTFKIEAAAQALVRALQDNGVASRRLPMEHSQSSPRESVS